MFDPEDETLCKDRSFVVDNLATTPSHLNAKETTLILVPLAPFVKIEKLKSGMGWRYSWYSSFGTDFNHDFIHNVTNDEAAVPVEEKIRERRRY